MEEGTDSETDEIKEGKTEEQQEAEDEEEQSFEETTRATEAIMLDLNIATKFKGVNLQ